MRNVVPFACCLFAVSLVFGQELERTFGCGFDAADAADFANRWETVGGTWRLQDGELRGTSATRRAFAYLPDLPEAARLAVRVSLRMTERTTAQGWCTAGVSVYLGATDFWQLALVEGPDHKRYAELVEMSAGNWQAQRSGDTALKQTADAGHWAGWEYNHEYTLTLALSPESVVGTVQDSATGTVVTRIAYEWGDKRGVRSGRPALVASGLALAAREVSVRWTEGVLGADFPAVVRGERGTAALLGEAPAMREALRQSGYGVTQVGYDDLATPGFLDARRFDVLVLPDSRQFPLAAQAELRRFVRGGGDLVLLGGMPFSVPLLKMGGQWRTEEAVTSVLDQTPVRHRLLDLTVGVAPGLQRATSRPQAPSQATVVAGPDGPALQLDIRGLKGWDTFARGLPDGLHAEDNVLCFQARTLTSAPAMVVELREEDGSRWLATVELKREWQPCALAPDRFEFWNDGLPTTRGKRGDQVRFPQVRLLSFGLAESHTPGLRGDHIVQIGQVGTGLADLPERSAAPEVPLNIGSDYRVYRMSDVREVVSVGEEGAALRVRGSYHGWSAVGFAFPHESVFVPLAEARDGEGRPLGWAAGALLNFRGPYRNSVWLMTGLEEAEFYESPAFLSALGEFLERVRSPEALRQARQADRTEPVAGYALKTAAPHGGFIRRSPDGRHLTYPDGRRFFMIGCNYVGGFTRCGGRMWSDDFFDAREVEEDFRKAHEAGLNVMRYWLQSSLDEDLRRGHTERIDTIRECARRYGVYLLIDLPGTSYTTEEAMLASHRRIAEVFRDEPMVLGYDLRNEPYASTLGGIHYAGSPPPIQTADLTRQFADVVMPDRIDAWVKERPRWLHLPLCIQGQEATRVATAHFLWSQYTRDTQLASSTLTGLRGAVPGGRWQPLVENVNQSLARWLAGQIRAIREVDPNHLITVGHNTALTILPANQPLDFVSEHIYARPRSYELVMENITTLDRLRELWPDRPITLGEFGYSNGIVLGEGYLDRYTSSMGEMVHYLYAFSHDYDGCKKWMLVDWPLAVMRHYGDWNRGLATRTYEERFGLFAYDGTRHGRAKPIVPALRFLRDVAERQAPGGQLEVVRDENPIGTGYVFRAPGVLMVGGRNVKLRELRYKSADTANVMLMWDEDGLRILATADVALELDPKALSASLAGGEPVGNGFRGAPSREGTVWHLELLAGRGVQFR